MAPGYEAFYEDDTGATQDLVSGDQVLFTPEPSMDWLDWLEGTYPVPTGIGAITPDAIGAAGQYLGRSRMFSYGQVLSDPVTVKQVAGDTFLPVLKVPKAVFGGTVKYELLCINSVLLCLIEWVVWCVQVLVANRKGGIECVGHAKRLLGWRAWRC